MEENCSASAPCPQDAPPREHIDSRRPVDHTPEHISPSVVELGVSEATMFSMSALVHRIIEVVTS